MLNHIQTRMGLGLIPALVVLLNFGLKSVLFEEVSIFQQAVYDAAVILIAGQMAWSAALRLGLPIWWRTGKASKRGKFILVGVGFVIIALNTYVNLDMMIHHEGQGLEMAPWMGKLTPWTAFLLSLRAALTEEILFRFFTISVIAWCLKVLSASLKISLVMASLASAVLFAWIHPAFLIPFIFGVMLAYVYVGFGLIPVFAIHFLANFIPFTLYALR